MGIKTQKGLPFISGYLKHLTVILKLSTVFMNQIKPPSFNLTSNKEKWYFHLCQ